VNDEGFDQNFTWYEWGFVSPGDVPTDDLSTPSHDNGEKNSTWRVADVWEDERRWTT
jgi:hypothetical protein